MPKITVYLPDEVATRIDKHKGTLNVSEVCQLAILRELETLDSITNLKGDPEMEKIMARLKKQKGAYEEEWERLGERDGLHTAKTLDYGTLRSIGSDQFPVSDLSNPWNMLPEDERYEINQSIKHDKEDSKYYNIDEDAYARGWLIGIRQFWDQVEDEI